MIVRVAAVPSPDRCDDTYENHQQRFHGAELNYMVCLRGIGGDASGDDSDADGGSGSAAKKQKVDHELYIR